MERLDGRRSGGVTWFSTPDKADAPMPDASPWRRDTSVHHLLDVSVPAWAVAVRGDVPAGDACSPRPLLLRAASRCADVAQIAVDDGVSEQTAAFRLRTTGVARQLAARPGTQR